MDVNEALWIERIHTPVAPGATPGVGGKKDSDFSKLLEQLRELSGRNDATTAELPEKVDGVDEAETFRRQMRQADDEFVAAMDLRRQLEDAYRRHQP